jgi:hypothetical protein
MTHDLRSGPLGAPSRVPRLLLLALRATTLAALPGCRSRSDKGGGTGSPIRIGFFVDSLQLERWQKDRD